MYDYFLQKDNYKEKVGFQMEKAINTQKKNRTGLIVGLVCLLLAVAVIGINVVSYFSTTARYNAVSVTSNNIELKNSEVSYFFNTVYQDYLNTYSSYISYLGLDTTKSLKAQEVSEGYTWFDYFMDTAKSQIKQIVLFAEAAKENGLDLTEEDIKSIDSQISLLSAYASIYGYPLEGYIKLNYGNAVSEESLRECMKLQFLADKYREVYVDSLVYTDEDYNAYYEENSTDVLHADYKSYRINIENDGSIAKEDVEAAKAEAKAIADEIASAKTPEEFDEKLRAYLISQLDAEKAEDETELEKIETSIKGTLNEGYPYSDSTDIGKWIFAEGRTEYETTVLETESYYLPIMLIKPEYRDETLTKNIHSIIIDKSQFESEEEAKAKADELVESFKSGELTADNFIALDSGAVSYENYVSGDSTTEVDAWVLSADRKVGDVEVIANKTYGYEILFYESDGIEIWKEQARDVLMNEDFNATIEEFTTKYNYTENADNLAKIDA